MSRFVFLALVFSTTAAAHGQLRMFMAADGDEFSANPAGSTTVFVESGSSTRALVWFDSNGEDVTVSGYQFLLPYVATPLPGSTGSVEYIDGPGSYVCNTQEIELFNAPCDPDDATACGGNPDDCIFSTAGDSIFTDQARPDYLFADINSVPPVYTESFNLTPVSFGMLVFVVDTSTGTDPVGIRYLAQFDISASADASGEFELLFRQPPLSPPLSFALGPLGINLTPLTLQPLTIVVTHCGDGVVEGNEECDDGNTEDGDGCSSTCTIETQVPAVSATGMTVLCLVLLGALACWIRGRDEPQRT